MSFIYSSAQFLSKSYFNLFHNFEVVGLENIPEKRPFLLASNHASFIDPPALGALFRGIFAILQEEVYLNSF